MTWDRQQAQEANEEEERWMSFIMFATPPMPQTFFPIYDPITPHISHSNTQPGTNMEEQSQSEEH